MSRRLNEMPKSVQLIEIIWFLSALPGLYVWNTNAKEAILNYMAARKSKVTKSIIWARMGVILTLVATSVDVGMVMVSVFGMTRTPATDKTTLLGYFITGELVLVSIGVLVVGIFWRHAEQMILRGD